MGRADLVLAIGRDGECTRPVDATPEHAQHVERRLVAPVQVLEDQHGAGPQLVDQRVRDEARLARFGHVSDVEER